MDQNKGGPGISKDINKDINKDISRDLGGIRLVAADLDGTLLDSGKRLTERTRAVLEKAADKGIIFVPATGRFFRSMPREIQDLPFLRYAILANGAAVWDKAENCPVFRAELPVETAVEIMSFLDSYPVLYDCYKDGWGYMTASMQKHAEDFAPNSYFSWYIKTYRDPVPELKEYLLRTGGTVMKLQMMTHDRAVWEELYREIPLRFPGLSISSSVKYNVEINHEKASKGAALLALARHLGIPREQTMAFGDGLNDVSMIREAGIGVAMSNSMEPVLSAADLVTGSCDENGVAQVLETLI